MMAKLRIGLVGLGRLGRVYARDLSSRIATTKVTAVADTDGDLAERIAKEFDAGRAYADPAALIADPNVDAIVIVSPTDTHREVVERALDSKKPTFCEKPPAILLADAVAMAKAQARTGTFFQMGFMRRFDPVRGYRAQEPHANRAIAVAYAAGAVREADEAERRGAP